MTKHGLEDQMAEHGLEDQMAEHGLEDQMAKYGLEDQMAKHGLEDQTAEHIYCRDACFCGQQEQACGQQQSSYRDTKLYGNREELKKTATFILQTGLSVSQCSNDQEEEDTNFVKFTMHIQQK